MEKILDERCFPTLEARGRANSPQSPFKKMKKIMKNVVEVMYK